MSELLDKQQLFASLIPRLIDRARELGFDVTLGECWRTPEQAAWNADRGIGTRTSLHISRLAIDLNLYRNGVWLKESTDHTSLGAYWKTLNVLCRWGGDFKPRADGNHYSMEHEGRA